MRACWICGIGLILVPLLAVACGGTAAPTPSSAQIATATMASATRAVASTAAPTVPPTVSMADWLVFQYEPFALSFKYPKSWYPHTVREIAGTVIKLSYPVDNPSTQSWATGEQASLQISQAPLEKGESFADWVQEQVNQKGSTLKDAQQRQIVVANVQGIEFTTPAATFRQVALPLQGFVYSFRFSTNPTLSMESPVLGNTFSQMLSTVQVDAAALAKLAALPPASPTIPAGRVPNLLRPTLPPGTPGPNLVSAGASPTAPRLTPTATLPLAASLPATLTPTRALPSPAATPAARPVPPPGVYVTKIQMEPPNPNIVQDIRFFVSFWNTAGPLQFKWCVYIFNSGSSSPRGQTSCNSLVDFPLGTYEYSTPNTWKLGPGTPCTDLFAQVQGVETNGARLIFKTPDFTENGLYFRVCP